LSKKLKSQILNKKLTLAGFFLHLGIIAGIIDSCWALRDYLEAVNIPIASLSFLTTSVFIYGLAGFVWSIPVALLERRLTESSDAKDNERVISVASGMLVPFMLIPVIFVLVETLHAPPIALFPFLKLIVVVVLIIIYARLLYFGGRAFFKYLFKTKISLMPLILSELIVFIFGYFAIIGISFGNLAINAIIAFVLANACWMLFRSRFSPIRNSVVRNIFRIAIVCIMLFPIATGLFTREDTSGLETVNGHGSIIVISIDALRADYLPQYGSNLTEAPNITRFSQNAVAFDKMYAVAPWTLPSIASLFTGVYPTVHGANIETHKVHSEMPILTETLKEQGYSTGAFVINPMLAISAELNKGFDEYYEPHSMKGPFSNLRTFIFYHQHIFLELCERRFIHFDGIFANKMESKLFPWIKKHKNEKVFLWVHYFAPHIPYCPPDRYLKRENQQGDGSINYASYRLILNTSSGIPRCSEKKLNCLKDLYSGDIEFSDERVGVLLEKIKEAGWTDSTIIITADHGDELFEHGSFDHGHTFYNELVHIPLIIHTGNGVMPIPDGREKKPVSMLDLTATICDIAGVENSDFYRQLQGTSIYSDTPGGKSTDLIFIESTHRGFPERIAVIKNDVKYFAYADDEIREVFNLIDDPFELYNIINSVPDEILVEIGKDIDKWRSENEILRRSLRSNPDEDEKANYTRNTLKGLGYI